jgi:hypothetical protein
LTDVTGVDGQLAGVLDATGRLFGIFFAFGGFAGRRDRSGFAVDA